MNLTNLINADTDMPANVREALLGAIGQRGKGKGYVKNNPPATTKPGYVGWQALISVLAPVRMSVAGLMFMNASDRELFDACDAWCEKYRGVINAIGQHPFQFNMWHHSNNPDLVKLRALIARLPNIDEAKLDNA